MGVGVGLPTLTKLGRLALAALVIASALCASAARAQSSPDVARGLAWLQSQVQADGSLTNEAASVATALQNRAEAAQTLAALAAVPAGLADALGAETDGNTEYLARQAIALIGAGRDASAQVSALLLRRNADRGFGGGSGFESNPLDTAWAVLALTRAGQGAGAPARDARAYLTASLQADGGMAASNDVLRVECSALALFALQTTADGSTATAVRALAGWLQQRQAADGGWLGDVHLTALALIAIAPAVSDPALRDAAGAFLLGRQNAAGSWLDDPFLSAIALRALGAGAASPAAATLSGQVVDQATNQPLAGAAVALSGAGAGSALTDAEGRFGIANLSAGSYSVQVTRAGYAGASAAYSLFAGQTLDAGRIALAQIPTTGIVRGRITAATGGAPLPGVSVMIAGSTTLSALTDALGAFEFSGVPPGALSISASLAGYQEAGGTASIAGGQTLEFSPALYTTAETAPTTGRFIGRTVVAGTGAPLAGVTLTLNGTAAGTTGADGSFDLTLAPASYVALYALSGYDGASQGFVLAAGATVDAGTVALPAQRTTTRLSGRVTDRDGLPLAGATVQLVGGTSAAAGADGVYVLDELAGTQFDLRVSATGYASQLVTLQVSRPSDVVHDFSLFAGSASFAIGEPQVLPAEAGANTNVAVSASVTNLGASEASAVALLQIVDADGAVIGSAGAFDETGTPVSQLLLAAEETRALRFTWNTGRFAPGRYDLIVRLVAPDSISAQTPQGSLLLERPASASVTAQAHFTGSVTANPPVLRAGTNTPVALSATLQNDGNTLLPAQSYTLSVIDTLSNAVAHSQTAAGAPLAVSEVGTLPFADWTPAAGGNFRIELASSNPAEGKISASLYVGDAGSAKYTASKLVVPAGTQTVRANIRVTGQDVEDGTIADPLAPLVRTAIQRAVTYTDTSTRQWTMTNKCMGCHTQSQALVGGELNRNLATFNPRTRATILNAVTGEQRANGSLSETQGGSFARTMTTLGLWGLASYRDKPFIAATLKKASDYLVTQQDGLGRWFADHSSGWWQSEVTNTAFNLKNLAEMHGVLGAVDPQSIVNYATRAFAQNLGRTSRGFIGLDGAGNLYFSASSHGQVVQIRPDGTFGTIWSGLSDPRGVVEVRGDMVVATGTGLRRLNADGTNTQLNTHASLDGLTLGPDGKLYSNDFGLHRIYQIDEGWAVTIWASGAPLSNPSRIAFTPSGDLLIANVSGRNILRYKPNKAVDAVIELTYGQPLQVVQDGSSWLVATTTGVYRYNADFEGGERLIFERADMVQRLPDGRQVFAVNGAANLKEMFGTVPDTAASLASYATAVDRATTYLTNLNTLGSSDNLVLAHHILGAGAAEQFYKATNPGRAATLRAKMEQIAATLRARVRADGGWGRTTAHGSDSMVTAQVGVALDFLNPSPEDPIVRRAVQLLLNRQLADGSWRSENGILPTNQAATSWVAIWLPIILNRLGGIDTDLAVTFAPNAAMSNADRAPTSSVVHPDGSRTSVWRLVGVTAAGQEINYDVTLADMNVNEVRALSTDAHLTFRNSFTGGNVDAPIDVPRVTASAFLELGVTTDRMSYGANTAVGITGQVSHTAPGLGSGSVKFEIYAPDDGLVADLGSLPFGDLPEGGQANLTPAWNTGGTLAAPGFYVLATLLDSQGRFVGTARSAFAIAGTDGGAPAATRISTDKQAYLPSDTVGLASRALNLSQNQPLDNVTLVTTVLNADGSVRFSRSELIPQLVQAALRDYGYAVPLAFAPAGAYSASAVLRDAAGATLASSSASFAVLSSAATGSGLAGTVLATPKQVPLGDAALIDFTARNQGNSALAGLPLTLSVVEPQSEQVVAQFPYTIDLATGATHQGITSWMPNGAIGTAYVAVLSALVNGATLTLAQDSFVLVAPPVRLNVALDTPRQGRVLALVACKTDHRDDDDDDERDDDQDHAHDGHCDHHRRASHPGSCSEERAAFLRGYLTGLGVTHLVTTDTQAFKKAFRSGQYNTYWITGGRSKLHERLAEEIREAVFRGDALLLDSVHDERNHELDPAVGVKYRGKLGAHGNGMELTGPIFTPGLMPVDGRPLKLELTTGQLQARFTGWHSYPRPAVVSNPYGLGRGVIFAYDLVSTLMRRPSAQQDRMVLEGLGWLTPAVPPVFTGRDYAVVRTRIENLAQAVELRATFTAPAGSAVLGTAPAAAPDANGNPVWAFTLPVDGTQDLFAALRLPAQSGTHAASVKVESVRNGIVTTYGTFGTTLAVEASEAVATRVVDGLGALTLASHDKADRMHAIWHLYAAQWHLGAGSHESAIGHLVEAADALLKITSADVAPYRVDTALLLKEAQARWAAAQP